MPKRNALQDRILAGLAQGGHGPIVWQDLAKKLGLPTSQYGDFKKTIDQLHRDGRVVLGEDNTVHLPGPGGLFVGTYRLHERGFGFVIPSDPDLTEDLYIPRGGGLDAVTGDLVQARVMRRGRGRAVRLYGQIERIIARGKDTFVGTLFRAANHWMVQTDGKVLHQPIMVDDAAAKNARAGDRVVVKLTEYPREERTPRGVIVEILGSEGDLQTEQMVVIRDFDLPDRFGPKVGPELDRLIERFNRTAGQQLAAGKVPRGRRDLRNELIVTIDPEAARDYDDGFSIKRIQDGQVELAVHIADVSAFVRSGSVLDGEAAERGNSVYLPRRVLPMLPEVLSNGLCSLQEGEDRLAKSVFIRYDAGARIVSTRAANTVVRSTKRLTYEQASAALDGKKAGLPKAVVRLLKDAEQLARRIFKRRKQQGMLHLDLPEVELQYSDDGALIDAHPADTSFSHTIIEMFMVEANEAVAAMLDGYDIPFIRRIHPPPAADATDQLRTFLTVFGYKLPKKPTPHDIQNLIQSAEGRPESFAINFAVLRSLQQAEYSIDRQGHYALAGEHYCHFTSPIRRYPDLVIHRLLQDHLIGRLKQKVKTIRKRSDALAEIAERCSFTDRRAEQAERELTKRLILQWLSEQIGRQYSGIVAGVSAIGAFVRLDKVLIEGLVRTEDLGDDWWELHVDRGEIFGRRSERSIKIGDPIDVTIVSIDLVRRQLNLAPVEPLLLSRQASKGEKTARRKMRPKRARKKRLCKRKHPRF